MPRQDQYVALREHTFSLNMYKCLYAVETVSSFLVLPVPSCLRESMAALARLAVGRLLSCLQSALRWRSMAAVGQCLPGMRCGWRGVGVAFTGWHSLI